MKTLSIVLAALLVGCSNVATNGSPDANDDVSGQTRFGGASLHDGDNANECGSATVTVTITDVADKRVIQYDELIPCDPFYHDKGDPAPDSYERTLDRAEQVARERGLGEHKISVELQRSNAT